METKLTNIATQKLVNIGGEQFKVIDIPTVKSQELVNSIKRGDRVTILVYNGYARHNGGTVVEWVEKTGTAVMFARGGIGWVLNMGGRYGTPGVAAADNTIAVRKARKGGR